MIFSSVRLTQRRVDPLFVNIYRPVRKSDVRTFWERFNQWFLHRSESGSFYNAGNHSNRVELLAALSTRVFKFRPKQFLHRS